MITAKQVKAPQMSALTSATMDLLKVGLVSDKISPMELRTFADWTIRPRVLAVPGVARCIIFGGEVRELANSSPAKPLDGFWPFACPTCLPPRSFRPA